jgi:hypothetical protein
MRNPALRGLPTGEAISQQSRDRKPLRLACGNPPPLARGGFLRTANGGQMPPLARGGAEAFAEAERFLNRERYARPPSQQKAPVKAGTKAICPRSLRLHEKPGCAGPPYRGGYFAAEPRSKTSPSCLRQSTSPCQGRLFYALLTAGKCLPWQGEVPRHSPRRRGF